MVKTPVSLFNNIYKSTGAILDHLRIYPLTMIKKVLPTDHDQQQLLQVSVDPATQQDDFFDYSKVVVRKPWGYEYLLYQNGVVAVWVLYIKKGFQTSMHCHPNKKTSLVLLSGEALCANLHQETKLQPGDGLLIEKGVFHRTTSLSDGGIFVMEIETPINKRDLLRLKDSYGRVGQGYETVDQMSYNLQNYNYINLIEPNVFYNVKKKFSQCSLSLAAFTDYADFQRNFRAEGWNAICILKGSIGKGDLGQGTKSIVLEVGDTLDIEQIAAHQNLTMEGPLEIITIQKRDRITKLSDYVVSFLEQQHISSIFVVPGSANVHLLDSLGRNTNLNHITTQTEQAATQAAEAYAKLTGKTGVAIIAAGSASTNALTGVASSWVDSTPLLIISGQSQSDQTSGNSSSNSFPSSPSSLRQLGVQEIDIITMVKPITKYAVRVTDPLTIRFHLEQALFLAQEGKKGPVWLDLPIDVQGMNIDDGELVSFTPSPSTAAPSIPSTPTSTFLLVPAVQKTYHFLRAAQRPVLLIGNGVRLSNSEQEAKELITKLQIPVLLSKRAADLLPENYPFYYGRPGAYGQRSANFIIQNSDLLLSIGCRLSIPLLGRNYPAFARAATKIVVDIDHAELQKSTIVPDLAVACSAKEFIQEMVRQFPSSEQRDYRSWLEHCHRWKEKYQFEPVNGGEGDSPNSLDRINVYTVIRLLSQLLPEGSIITIDGGSPNIFMMQQFQFKEGQRLISSTGLENISFGLPAAIGASIGGTTPILCLCEDRGFQKNVQELETILNYSLPIKILVLNQGGYSYVQKTQKDYFGSRFVASKTGREQGFPNLASIAAAYTIPHQKIEANTQLEPSLKSFLQHPGTAICEIVIDPGQEIVPRIVFEVRPDGKWLAKPLEDMYPFLNRKEFKENMIVEPLPED